LFGRAIGRIVIDKDDFILNALQRFGQTFEDRGHIITLFEGGDNDGELDVAGERHIG
jgi:hypothetical protein